MIEVNSKAEKIEIIKETFLPLIGKRISHFDTAQLKMEMGEWDDWFDLPIRLFFDANEIVSIAWSHFETLFISSDSSLNFPIDDAQVRWVKNNVSFLLPVINEAIQSVMIGRGELSFDGQDVEIWTRLVVQLETGWFEIYNRLDENAFVFHSEKPEGVFEFVC